MRRKAMEDAQVAYNTRGVRLEGARALGALPWASENAAVGAFVLRLFRFVIARVKRVSNNHETDRPLTGASHETLLRDSRD